MSSSLKKALRISVIGGGPAGLTLARILQQTTSPSELQITVYERDPHPTARLLSGTLDLHPPTGLRAVRDAGLVEEFKKYARREGDEFKVYDKWGNMTYESAHSPAGFKEGEEVAGKPEIDRIDLRNMLVASLDPKSIKWGYKLVSIQPVAGSTTNEHELTFSSGEKITSDLVVGADGAWSRIRSFVNPTAIPVYSGFSSFDVRITNADVRYPKLGKMNGNGIAAFLGDKKLLFVQRNSHGKLNVVAYMRREEGWIDQFEGLEPKALKESICAQFEGWSDDVLEFVRAADDDTIVLRKVFATPLNTYKYPSHPSITLIGDAAHLMSPFAGEGVNLAMADAADLAAQLRLFLSSQSLPNSKSKRTTLQDALNAYTKQMVKRALPAGRDSAQNLDMCDDDEALEMTTRAGPLVEAQFKNVGLFGYPVGAMLGLLRWIVWREIRRAFWRVVNRVF